jgi:hypothetical protein
MPTKRTRRQPERSGISTPALAAWRTGDYLELKRLLGIGPHQAGPFVFVDLGRG